jgi:hypothetical protein
MFHLNYDVKNNNHTLGHVLVHHKAFYIFSTYLILPLSGTNWCALCFSIFFIVSPCSISKEFRHKKLFPQTIPTFVILPYKVKALSTECWVYTYVHCMWDELFTVYQKCMSTYVAKYRAGNPKSNRVIKRVQLTIGDVLRTMSFSGEVWLF